MSGDVQQAGEKLWEVREVSGRRGYSQRTVHVTRYFFATSRKDAKEQFVKAGYKQYESSRLTAMRIEE